MIRKKNIQVILGTLIALSVGVLPSALFAYQIDTVQVVNKQPDFVVGPGKIDVTIEPGKSKTVFLLVTNRMGDERIFNVSVEDFTGTNDLNKPVQLLGEQRGPYSLRDYLKFEEDSFVLKNGQRARIPVTIAIPHDEEPGGRYGSVLISTISKNQGREGEFGAAGGTSIVSRIGTLFFVRVPGNMHVEGTLDRFLIQGEKKVFNSAPVPFQLLFENTGSVHLTPYGEIKVTNLLGSEVGFVEIEPWFAMPKSTRLREVVWGGDFLFGRYTATANINRGYDDIIDTQTVVFYVLPWKMVGGILFGIFLILLLLRWIGSKIEIKVK